MMMEVGEKLKELNMTPDEVDKFTKAFKDDEFKRMLFDYVTELSDPEVKRKNEEEIKLLEQERGNNIQFIHPEPFRALRTRVDGSQTCFINICGNDKIAEPECKMGVSEDGRRGQRWSLPHSLHPGRQEVSPKGKKILIYDVIFHPNTLHMAAKSRRFMDMVDSTALQGVRDAFKVTLDKKVRRLRSRYKGTPRPCVIRTPIPGFEAKEPPEDTLAFPYPDDPPRTTSPKNKEPTEPKYSVKYRSFIDMQDFRCSRDSGQTPRPKEIVVTIELPLLRSAADAHLEVKEKTLLLESHTPAYRLELPLSYPVDEERGEAKFSKDRGRLTVTLPVLPPTFQLAAEKEEEERGGQGEESHGEPAQNGGGVSVGEDEEQRWEKRGNSSEQHTASEDQKNIPQPSTGDAAEDGDLDTRYESTQQTGASEIQDERDQTGENVGGFVKETDVTPEESQTSAAESPTQTATDNTGRYCGSAPETSCNAHVSQEPGCDPQGPDADHLEPGHNPQEPGCDPQGPDADHLEPGHNPQEPGCDPEEPGCDPKELGCDPQEPDIDHLEPGFEPKEPCRDPKELGDDPQEPCRDPEEPGRRSETKVQSVQTPQGTEKPPPVLLREVDKDGNETVVSDRCTSAAIVFQNSLLYELD